MIHELVYFKFNIWALSKDRTEYNLTNYFYKVLEKKDVGSLAANTISFIGFWLIPS